MRGMSLIEVMATALLLGFLLSAVGSMFSTTRRLSLRAKGYVQTQEDLRTSLRRAMRTLRHGYEVVMSSRTYTASESVTSFNASSSRDSSASQVTVRVPEPAGTSPTSVELRIYLSGGTIYAQRADQGNASQAGTALVTGVSNMTVNYWNTSGGVRTATDGAPASASEVEIKATSASAGMGAVTTTAETLVSLRNYLLTH